MVAPQSPIRLFENRWLEKLTVIAVPTFMVLWAIGLAGVAWTAWGTSSAGFAVLLAVAGLDMWTLTEYALQRFVFNWEPKSAVLRRFVLIIHGNHPSVLKDRKSVVLGKRVYVCVDSSGYRE